MEKNHFLKLRDNFQNASPDNLKAALELITQGLWIGLGVFLSFRSGPYWLLGQLLLGTGFWRSFAIMHAAGHGGFFSSNKLNDLTGLVTSFSCHIPYFPWKYIHQEHHRWTGWIDLDPTMADISRNDLPEMHKKIVNFAWKWWLPLLTVVFILKNFFTFRHMVISGDKKNKSLFSIVSLVVFHLTLIFFWKYDYLKIFGFSTFIYFTLGDLSLLAQHVGLPMENSVGLEVRPKALHEHDQYSRTMLLPLWFDRYVALGFNHHAFHHLFPKRPYYLRTDEALKVGHVNDWKDWIKKAKSMRATELIYPEL